MTDNPKETRHTPELIFEECGNILFRDGRLLVEFDSTTDTIEELRRIVSAVNNYDSLVREKDELREAAKKMVELHDGWDDGNGEMKSACAELKAVLAKSSGGK